MSDTVDTTSILSSAVAPGLAARGISEMAQKLVASEILKIAGEIRAMVANGAQVLNLTVGDFAPKEFPIPPSLAAGVTAALAAGHTNYPPSSGMEDCRQAVRELFASRLGLSYPLSSVLIASGARPMIAGIYYALVSPGDVVVYGVPSWNNNHYCTLTGAQAVEIETTAETGFFPRVSELAPHLPRARLICLNTPNNPTGTAIDAAALTELSQAIVFENARRKAAGTPPVYLMFDQVYWMLTAPGTAHVTPVSLVPEMAAYTLFVDGISKAFAATGLRVGWAVGPTDVIERMAAILTHIGAWAPRAEQVATAALLRDGPAMDTFLARMNHEVFARLDLLAGAIARLAEAGFPVQAVAPAGAIYLSIHFAIAGKVTPEGKTLVTDEDIRVFLLERAGLALVGFRAFGLTHDSGWFRASVGAVSLSELERGVARLEGALASLRS